MRKDNKYATPERANDRFRQDVEFIEEWSKEHKDESDMLLDIGLLTHIYVKRRWVGTYQDWTDVAVYWMADRSKMSKPRVKESLKRLEDWGMIVAMPRKGDLYKAALKYKYVNRAHVNDVTMKGRFEKVEEVPDEVEETPEVVEHKLVKQEMPRKPVVAPPVKYTVYTRLTDWWRTPDEWPHLSTASVDREEYEALPVCSVCGRKIKDAMLDGVCDDCRTVDWIEHQLNNGAFPLKLTEEDKANALKHPAWALATREKAKLWLLAHKDSLTAARRDNLTATNK